jgi:hypothetical protein
MHGQEQICFFCSAIHMTCLKLNKWHPPMCVISNFHSLTWPCIGCSYPLLSEVGWLERQEFSQIKLWSPQSRSQAKLPNTTNAFFPRLRRDSRHLVVLMYSVWDPGEGSQFEISKKQCMVCATPEPSIHVGNRGSPSALSDSSSGMGSALFSWWASCR